MRAGDIGASYTTTRGRAASSQRVAAEAGVTSYGLTIELPGEEPAHPWAKVRVPFHYFFLRKLAFVKYGCAFICFPGGFGTLDELFEALNLKGAHRLSPFPVILAGPRYWTGLVDWLSNVSVPTGCLSPEHLHTFEILDDPVAIARRAVECHATLCRTLVQTES
jgi:uncharacterized protein (TIGR00730 family)